MATRPSKASVKQRCRPSVVRLLKVGRLLNQNKDMIEIERFMAPIAMKQSLAYNRYNGTICSKISMCVPCNIPSVPQEFYQEILDKKFIKERREEIRKHHGLGARDPTVPHMHQRPLLIT